MRSLITACLICFCLPQFAQTGDVSKEEVKKWKDMAKEYKKEPLKLKDKIEGYERMTEELQTTADELTEDNATLTSEKETLGNKVSNLNKRIASLENELAEKDSIIQSAETVAGSEDLQFYVQVGAYEFFDINEYFAGDKCMDVQLNDGLNKYVVGSFSDVANAESFRKDVIKLGIEDAWVVPIQNGVRIPMEDALNQLEISGTLTPEQLEELRSLYLK